jgi:hypothetical protein
MRDNVRREVVVCFVGINRIVDHSGADPETLLTGGRLSFGAIFSIIDGTNCSQIIINWLKSTQQGFV